MEFNLLMRKIYRFLKTGSPQTIDYRNYRTVLATNEFNYDSSYFNLTIDFELAWSRARRGNSVTSTEESVERSRRARLLLPILISLSEKYSIPITFAVVAHVALEN